MLSVAIISFHRSDISYVNVILRIVNSLLQNELTLTKENLAKFVQQLKSFAWTEEIILSVKIAHNLICSLKSPVDIAQYEDFLAAVQNFYIQIGNQAPWAVWADDLIMGQYTEHVNFSSLIDKPQAWQLLLKFGRAEDVDWDKLSSHFFGQELSTELIKTFYSQKLWSTKLADVLVNNIHTNSAEHAHAVEWWQFFLRNQPLDTCAFLATDSAFLNNICENPDKASLNLLFLFLQQMEAAQLSIDEQKLKNLCEKLALTVSSEQANMEIRSMAWQLKKQCKVKIEEQEIILSVAGEFDQLMIDPFELI